VVTAGGLVAEARDRGYNQTTLLGMGSYVPNMVGMAYLVPRAQGTPPLTTP